jgi:CheY-like chemotaxis protein
MDPPAGVAPAPVHGPTVRATLVTGRAVFRSPRGVLIRPAAATPVSLLIVEDDHDTRVLLRATLEGQGYVVHTAANGRDALLLLDELAEPPRLIIVDLRMPVMDGWQLMGHLRSDARLSGIPIGVQTGSIETTLPDGVSFVLPKPVDVAALLALVRHHCP